DGFFFAVIFVGELAVLEGDGLAFGKEGDLDQVFGRSFCGRGSRALIFFVCHHCSSVLLIILSGADFAFSLKSAESNDPCDRDCRCARRNPSTTHRRAALGRARLRMTEPKSANHSNSALATG